MSARPWEHGNLALVILHANADRGISGSIECWLLLKANFVGGGCVSVRAAVQTTRCILRKIQVSDNTPVSSVHYEEYLCVSMSSTFQYVNVSNETLTGTLHYLMTAK